MEALSRGSLLLLLLSARCARAAAMFLCADATSAASVAAARAFSYSPTASSSRLRQCRWLQHIVTDGRSRQHEVQCLNSMQSNPCKGWGQPTQLTCAASPLRPHALAENRHCLLFVSDHSYSGACGCLRPDLSFRSFGHLPCFLHQTTPCQTQSRNGITFNMTTALLKWYIATEAYGPYPVPCTSSSYPTCFRNEQGETCSFGSFTSALV